MTNPFSKKLLTWYEAYGRHDLPWQKNQSHYRVWISEIMLQQTQVTTVIPYYERFMTSFPDVFSLANADEDSVLHHWSGLGYYARARNIHKTAKIVANDLKGIFPTTVEAFSALPGIGQSTAGAIISFAQQEKAVILDGNVKRVLSRYFAIDDMKKDLWPLAENLTPHKNAHLYNQAIMDLGATLCTRTKPRCQECPVKKDCAGFLTGEPTQYPLKIAKKTRPIKNITMLILENARGEVLLIKRPAKGIWGGLWSFPEMTRSSSFAEDDKINLPLSAQMDKPVVIPCSNQKILAVITHQFTHFTLHITPIVIKTRKKIEGDALVWHKLGENLPGGIAAPVARILDGL